MKVIIAGGRNIVDFRYVADACTNAPFQITEVVSGCARGVDTLALEIANDLKISTAEFPADWDRYGKTAGFKRNMKMAEYADVLLAIWDGESKGTKHMIDSMFLLRKPVVVVFHKVSDHFF